MINRLSESGRLRLSLVLLVAVACIIGGYVALDPHDPARAKVVTPTTTDEDVVVSHDDTTPVDTTPVKSRKLRPGEQRTDLQIPEPYTPASPTGKGTDDYRCFLLDPNPVSYTHLTLPTNREV